MQHILGQLGDFGGTLITEGYGANEKKKNQALTHAQFWPHCRRKFDKAKDAEPEASAIALAYNGRLYEHEAYLCNEEISAEEKLHYRVQLCLPVVDAFFAWCYEQQQRIDLTKTNPLSKALTYAMKRQQALKEFLSDPKVPLDTNHLERALRVIPMEELVVQLDRNWRRTCRHYPKLAGNLQAARG